MSAQTLLSIVAPAVPTPSQGSSGAAAPGFQGLLDTLLDAEAVTAAPAPATTAPADAATGVGDKAATDAPPAGLMILPAAPPPPVIPPVTPETTDGETAARPRTEATPPAIAAGVGTDVTAGLTGDGDADITASAPLTPPASSGSVSPSTTAAPAQPAAQPVAAVTPPTPAPSAAPAVAQPAAASPAPDAGIAVPAPPATGPQSTTPVLPTDKTRASKAGEPQVQPRVADVRPLLGPRATNTVATRTDAPVETTPETPVDAPDGRVQPAPAAAVGAVQPAPTPAPTPPPTPAPLRALAERTSRPLEGTAIGAGQAAAPGETRPAAAVTTAPPAPGATPDSLHRAAEPAAAAVVQATEAGPPPSETPAPAEASAPGAQTAAAVRDAGLSGLSRTTIEATAQIAAQILRKLEGRSTRFEMALTPDELGRVDVKLDIDSEGRLAARLAFDNPAAATDLRGRADELRRQLQDAGFHLAEDAFEFTGRDSGSSAFDRGQHSRDDQTKAFAAASRRNAEIDVAQPPRWMALTLSPSGVDMKV